MFRFIFFIISLLFFMTPGVSIAKEYDFYVDSLSFEDGNGSENEPFSDIKKAISAMDAKGGGGSIFVKDGSYDGGFIVGKTVGIFGQSEGGVVISGTVQMLDGSALESLTISGGQNSVIVSEGANVKIVNCTVRKSISIGINVVSGNGKLTLLGSKIQDGLGKGLYIQKGNAISISGSSISGNAQEGLDIRAEVSGDVFDNVISGNGEGGIEIIVGESDLNISRNVIKSNKASGIATQFYSEFGDGGRVAIVDNRIYDNGKYGVDCNKPQGGSTDSSYWAERINLEGNDIYSNRRKSTNSNCGFFREDSGSQKEMEKENIIIESKQDEKSEAELDNVTVENNEKLEEIKRKEGEMEEDRLRKVEEIKTAIQKQKKTIENIGNDIEKFRSTKVIRRFFVGVKKDELAGLFSELEKSEYQLNEIRGEFVNVYLNENEEMEIEGGIEEVTDEISREKSMLDDEINSFSVLGWLRNLFEM